jgi:hypothetical protein
MRGDLITGAGFAFAVAGGAGGCVGPAASDARALEPASALDGGTASASGDATSPEMTTTPTAPSIPVSLSASTSPPGPTLDGAAEARALGDAGPEGASQASSAAEASAGASGALGAPPPISGGTLLVLADGNTAVASDPDRDLVYVVDTAAKSLLSTITLTPGDEPGRLVADGSGRIHVALRSGGAIVTVDPKAGRIVERRAVCPAPRGLAWDPATDTIWVACATGELVGLPAAGGAPTVARVVERDIRDVVVTAEGLTLSKFRSAELLRLASDGTILRRDSMPPVGASAAPHVAWRTRLLADGDTVTLHQEHSLSSISTTTPDGGAVLGAYVTQNAAMPGAGIVTPHCSVLGPDGSLVSTFPLGVVLAFDMAVSNDGSSIVVAGSGSASAETPVVEEASLDGTAGASISSSQWNSGGGGAVTAVAFDGQGNVIAQTRQPATLTIFGSGQNSDGTPDLYPATVIALSPVSRDDSGHDQFHAPTIAGLACASCHPEGGDDGHVWQLDGQPRRTPSLRGTVAGTAPYHWGGDEADFPTLVRDVLTNRMSGPMLTDSQMEALTQWVQSIPAPAAPTWVDAASAGRGAVLFSSAAIGCSTCHSGPKLTNNLTLNVGTGRAFQVPPLVGVGWRTPLLHDGCATTLADRFGACATTGHGVTSGLGTQDVNDLVAYLETL